jgi:protein-S-isoprenylcysteine O-methyltransferase Ste14
MAVLNRPLPSTDLIIKALIRLVLVAPVLGLMLFLPAGRLDWSAAWVWLLTVLGCVGFNLLVLFKTNPEVLAERVELKRSDQKRDELLTGVVAVFWVSLLVVAGLDERFNWSPPLPLWLQGVALMMWVLADLLFLWGRAVNKFFSRAVRIQEERGHQVITTGPYRYVRHPGYLAWNLLSLTPPLILGSVWALIPAVLAVGGMVLRTAWEDQLLQQELEGYEAYARRVRYRLLPGVW